MTVYSQNGSTLLNFGSKIKYSCWEQSHLQPGSFDLAIKHKPSSYVCSSSSSFAQIAFLDSVFFYHPRICDAMLGTVMSY